MELDAKQKVLLAIYAEYQKDLPDMKNVINHKNLGLEQIVFRVAVDKLQSEGLIKNADIRTGGNTHVPLMVFMEDVKMTPYGIQYVEQKLSIDKTLTGEQKVKSIFERAGEWGWEQIKDITAKVIAEMTKTP